jgi:Zn-dependent protease
MLGLGLDPPTIITRLIVLVIAFTVHEFSHAWVATYFGDDTPRINGRLTLNPAAHLDIIGSLMLLLVGFGWAKPVPVNPYALRRRSSAALMWVSLAGPLSNFLLAVVASIPFRLGIVSIYNATNASGAILPSPASFLTEFISVNLLLMLFNLIPIAPLDGDKVIEYFFPPSWANVWESIRPYGPMILLVLLFVVPSLLHINIISAIIQPPFTILVRLLLG